MNGLINARKLKSIVPTTRKLWAPTSKWRELGLQSCERNTFCQGDSRVCQSIRKGCARWVSVISDPRTPLTFIQLYHSKLEQLTTLTSRINALSRTLGRDFYTKEITEPTPVAGENPHSHKDVTPERFLKLEKELVRGKGEVVSLPAPIIL